MALAKIVQNICYLGNFSQLVTKPTRMMFNSVTQTTEISCIDHMYTNAKFQCSKPVVVPFEPVTMILSPIQDIVQIVLQKVSLSGKDPSQISILQNL